MRILPRRARKLSYLGKRSESRVPLARVLLKISPKWRACSQATIQVVGVGWGGICLFSLCGCLLPYMGYIGMRHCEAYGFQVVYSGIGCISQRVQVQNRVSFSRKPINSWKILVSTRETRNCHSKISKIQIGKFKFTQLSLKATLGYGGIRGVQSSIGFQNKAELVLLQAMGSRVPAADPHPIIPKVPSPGFLELSHY